MRNFRYDIVKCFTDLWKRGKTEKLHILFGLFCRARWRILKPLNSLLRKFLKIFSGVAEKSWKNYGGNVPDVLIKVRRVFGRGKKIKTCDLNSLRNVSICFKCQLVNCQYRRFSELKLKISIVLNSNGKI